MGVEEGNVGWPCGGVCGKERIDGIPWFAGGVVKEKPPLAGVP